ncbi:MAG TPA: hypothetical protein VH518_19690 [Tepidisphaeraceae bacterium]|jgi:hypothetical protein
MKRHLAPISLTLCALLLAAFAVMSWTAVRTKSATTDEPLHTIGAYVRCFARDFRVNVEDPPLFGYWAMIPHNRGTLHLATDSPLWKAMLDDMWQQWEWSIGVLYQTPGNDPDALINSSRRMMLVIGIALGAVLAAWSWKLGGPVAAIVALLFYAFDPSFLGHAPLVKNDVPITLMIFATAMAAWSFGKDGRWWKAAILVVLCAAAVNVKFSGVIVLPMVALLLAGRAMLPQSWLVCGVNLTRVWQRLLTAVSVVFIAAVATIVLTWACYGFRFGPAPDPGTRLDVPHIAQAAASQRMIAQIQRRGRGHVPPEEYDVYRAAPFIRVILFADRHRLMPQAWLAGVLDTYASMAKRNNFLLGQIREGGTWYYFPLAMLFKTPVATLAALAGAFVVLWKVPGKPQVGSTRYWDSLCIALPMALYGITALTSNLNLGLRHVFPIYPFLFMTIGIAAARAISAMPRSGTIITALLAVGLVVESLAAWPNYIAFFNTPSGGWRGGIDLLGDSNLDWGQDLLGLKRWQQQHPDTRLYLSYFGMPDPAYYVKYIALPGNEMPAEHPEPITKPGVMAVSASQLQGIYLQPEERAFYEQLQSLRRPFDVIGGTIYLYDIGGP